MKTFEEAADNDQICPPGEKFKTRKRRVYKNRRKLAPKDAKFRSNKRRTIATETVITTGAILAETAIVLDTLKTVQKNLNQTRHRPDDAELVRKASASTLNHT